MSTQFDDLAQLESDLCENILLCKKEIPLPSTNPECMGVTDVEGEGNEDEAQLRLLHDLLQGNLQRCKHSIEQLNEAKQSMFNVSIYFVRISVVRGNRVHSVLPNRCPRWSSTGPPPVGGGQFGSSLANPLCDKKKCEICPKPRLRSLVILTRPNRLE